MIDPQLKEVIQVATPVLSALVGISAVVVAVRLGVLQRRIQEGQRKIQEGQLKHSLYDKRFSVYEGSRIYMVRLMQRNGAVDPADLEAYVPEIEKGEFLFGEDVQKFLIDLRELGINLYVKATEAAHLQTIREDSTTQHLEVTAMMKELCGAMLERRKSVFRPYLKLAG
jgi:hypothetical protein